MIANIITVSRIIFSALLLVFPQHSYSFAVLYLLCGVTDAIDGFLARKLHTESEKGAMLDSAADLVFAVVYVIKILPLLSMPLWIWIWTAIIAAAKITVILTTSKKTHRLLIGHSFGNRLTGLFLFLLPLSVCVLDVKYGAALVCAAATVTAVYEIIYELKKKD